MFYFKINFSGSPKNYLGYLDYFVAVFWNNMPCESAVKSFKMDYKCLSDYNMSDKQSQD